MLKVSPFLPQMTDIMINPAPARKIPKKQQQTEIRYEHKAFSYMWMFGKQSFKFKNWGTRKLKEQFKEFNM